MNVLVACEFSGVVRDAFTRRSHFAMSCDILPTERPGTHYQGDVIEFLEHNAVMFDLMIAHPPCTYLCNSGVRWLYNKDGTLCHDRWDKMAEARKFFFALLNARIPRIAVENPIPHRHTELPPYSQIIHPWQFGHGETKSTCLWLRGLPPLKPTNVVSGREARVHRMAPSEDRGKLRSVTYEGIAEAMVDQWGYLE